MSKAAMGAVVRYGGHDASFIADIHRIGNVNVVRASGPINEDVLTRPAGGYMGECTHEMLDFPEKCFWRPELGVFVVPEKQCREVEKDA